MNAIYGLFPNTDSARRALTALRAESSRLRIQPQAIVIMSSEPLEEEAFGWSEQRTALPWLAPLGGLIGGIGGYLLAAFTQRTYPLPTGGMPIVAMWPTGIVMYELTMLGAILTTIVTFLLGVKLPDYRRRLYDPEVTNGKILVGVANPERGSLKEIGQRLEAEGADAVKEFSDDLAVAEPGA